MSILFVGREHVSLKDKKPIKDKYGDPMHCADTYESRSSLNNFRSGITKILETLGHKNQAFFYPGENGNLVKIGHSFEQSTIKGRV